MRRVKKGSERRKWDRLPLAVPLFVRGVDDRGKEFMEFATAINISAGGALLAMRRFLPRTSRISLEIPSAPIPQMDSPHHFVRGLQGQAVRVTHSEQCYLVGLKFSQPMS